MNKKHKLITALLVSSLVVSPVSLVVEKNNIVKASNNVNYKEIVHVKKLNINEILEVYIFDHMRSQ